MSRTSRPLGSSHHSRLDVPARANRILNLVLLAFILILVRVWHLSVLQHEERSTNAQRPTRRTVVEPSRRATIRDRFGIPLAMNKMQYNAAVTYAHIREIPPIVWRKDEKGKKEKIYRRREYIRGLAELLAQELDLDADKVEDSIHAEAAFYDHVPYTIQQNITEEQYYRLKVRERHWPGLCAQHVPRRYYPKNKVASDIIGYMGAIDQVQYNQQIQLRRTLRDYVRRRETGDDPPLPAGMESPQQVRRKLQELEELAYSMTDTVGKSGVEGYFENQLRGYHGKKRYYADSRGHFLQELPGSKPPLPGRALRLTLSAELQEYAEQLLAQNELLRKPRVSKPHRGSNEKVLDPKDPWIKGGAIVAMEPKTGEVVALASFPRFDPNDFIPSGKAKEDEAKFANIRRWFETDSALGEIWDGKLPLKRELFAEEQGFYDEELPMTLDNYFSLTFHEEGGIMQGMRVIQTVGDALRVQKAVDSLVALAEGGNLYYLFNLLYQEQGHSKQRCPIPAYERERIEHNLNIEIEAVERVKAELDVYFSGIPHNYDKVLLVDLCRMLVSSEHFTGQGPRVVVEQKLTEYRQANQDTVVLLETVRTMAKRFYAQEVFSQWRLENEKTFLREKRREERRQGKYARPYTEHLAKEESRQFSQLWDAYGDSLFFLFLTGCNNCSVPEDTEQSAALHVLQEQFAHKYRRLLALSEVDVNWLPRYRRLQQVLRSLGPEEAAFYLTSMRRFDELTRPLYGRYRQLRKEKGKQFEKHLAAAFYPVYGYGYGRSLAYRQAATQGSIFKLVTAYAALVQQHERTPFHPNPLRMVDQPHRKGKDWFVGYDSHGKAIPRAYKGGTVPRTFMRNAGEMDVVRAIEVSSNSYFSLLASDVLKRPTDLAAAAEAFSFGEPTGIALPGEIFGNVPQDLDYNRTGLYTLAIGQHSLVVTPLQTTVMLASIANGGRVFVPQIVQKRPGSATDTVVHSGQNVSRFQDTLATVGIYFPLFGNGQRVQKSSEEENPPSLVRQLTMPSPVRRLLLEGMQKVAHRYQTKALYSYQKMYSEYPEAINSLKQLRGQLLSKTSTAENVESFGPDRLIGTRTYNHVWFGSISLKEPIDGAASSTSAWDQPELVVVVYLRYGAYGKDAAPLAAQIITKWREIQARH